MRDSSELARPVLLVGHTRTQDAVEEHLSAAGLSTEGAPDLLDALDRLDARTYACLLLADADRSPAEIVDRLRAAGHTLPIVAIVDDGLPDTTGVDAVAPVADPEAVAARVQATADEHRLERERAERRRLRDAIEQACDAALDAADTDAGLTALCSELVATGAYDIAWVGRRVEATEVLDPVAAAGVPLDHLGRVSIETDADTTAASAVETGNVAVETADDRSVLAVPLDDAPRAVLHVVGERVGGVSPGERDALAAIRTTLEPLFDDAGSVAGADDGVTVLGDALGHELGNQLDIALTHLELARERGDDSHFEHVETALDRMTDLADDARLLAGGEVAPEPIDLSEAAAAAWATIDAVDATLDADQATVEADPDLLELLLENLLRNAVEHGGPDVRVRVGATEDGFAVADDGPGIPPEHREHVLDWGYSTDGTGVGLGIVKLVAERHGWSVAVTESQAGGARIEFS